MTDMVTEIAYQDFTTWIYDTPVVFLFGHGHIGDAVKSPWMVNRYEGVRQAGTAIARWLKEHGWKEGTAVILAGCHSGSDPVKPALAQDVANALGKGQVVYGVDGKLFVARSVEWRRQHGQPISGRVKGYKGYTIAPDAFYDNGYEPSLTLRRFQGK